VVRRSGGGGSGSGGAKEPWNPGAQLPGPKDSHDKVEGLARLDDGRRRVRVVVPHAHPAVVEALDERAGQPRTGGVGPSTANDVGKVPQLVVVDDGALARPVDEEQDVQAWRGSSGESVVWPGKAQWGRASGTGTDQSWPPECQRGSSRAWPAAAAATVSTGGPRGVKCAAAGHGP
jgi:hypothetical protein